MAKIFLRWNVVTTSDVILVAKELDNLLAEVYRSPVYHAPHSQRQLTIDNLNPVMHQVQVWKTTDGTTLTQLMSYCDIDASLASSTAFEIIPFVVGRGLTGAPNYDPEDADTQYVNPDLDGKTYTVFRPGFGPLIWGVHIRAITGGGFEFIDPTWQFTDGEEYTIMISNPIQVISSSGKSYPDEIVEIAGNVTFGASHYNKLLEVNGAGLITITITDITVIPNTTKFGINTHNGTQTSVILQLPATKYCQVDGDQRNAVYIGRGEEVSFIKKGNYLRVVHWDGDHRRVGEIVKGTSKAPINSLPRIGGWKLMTDYPRLYNWYITELDPTEIFTDLTEATPADANKGKWGIGTTKFWVPDSRDRFDRNVYSTRVAGSVEAEMVGPHWHAVGTQNQHAPSDGLMPSFNRATPHGVRTWQTTNTLDANQNCSTDFNQDPTSPYAYSTETRPKNIGVNDYIIT